MRLIITPSEHTYILYSNRTCPKEVTKFLLSIVEEEIGDLSSEEAKDFLVFLRDLVCAKMGVNSLSEIGKE